MVVLTERDFEVDDNDSLDPYDDKKYPTYGRQDRLPKEREDFFERNPKYRNNPTYAKWYENKTYVRWRKDKEIYCDYLLKFLVEQTQCPPERRLLSLDSTVDDVFTDLLLKEAATFTYQETYGEVLLVIPMDVEPVTTELKERLILKALLWDKQVSKIAELEKKIQALEAEKDVNYENEIEAESFDEDDQASLEPYGSLQVAFEVARESSSSTGSNHAGSTRGQGEATLDYPSGGTQEAVDQTLEKIKEKLQSCAITHREISLNPIYSEWCKNKDGQEETHGDSDKTTRDDSDKEHDAVKDQDASKETVEGLNKSNNWDETLDEENKSLVEHNQGAANECRRDPTALIAHLDNIKWEISHRLELVKLHAGNEAKRASLLAKIDVLLEEQETLRAKLGVSYDESV